VTHQDVLAVIPVRWGSTRFPGKALADLSGRPLVEHVWRHATAARSIDRVVVATDDERIRAAVTAFGGEAVMTADTHQSGTDRVAEVALTTPCRIVVNIHGDEPLLGPGARDAAVAPLLADDNVEATTLAAPLAEGDDAGDPHLVKVVTAANGDALYFSRSPIPFRRNQEAGGGFLHHIGLYALRRELLAEFSRWAPGTLEQAEGLEQLRLLEHGRRLRVVLVPHSFPGIDTPEDLARVAARMDAPAP
jgi:3-deoxy-D-manno-octulosonate cytidylyltransferase